MTGVETGRGEACRALGKIERTTDTLRNERLKAGTATADWSRMKRPLAERSSAVVAVVGIGVAVLLAMLVGAQGSPPICAAEARLDRDRAVYGRDSSQACSFVDDQGDLIHQ